MTNRYLFSLLLVPMFLFGCATQQLSEFQTDGVYLNAEEVTSHVSGYTETWKKGAGYYAEDGKLLGVWAGKKVSGTWSVKDDGQLCTLVKAWGDEVCQKYVNENGQVNLVYKNQSSFREMKPGNQLDKL